MVTDGGVGTALGDASQQDALWGAQLLFTEDGNEQIQRVHRDFLSGGADIVTSASYCASYELFSAASTFSELPADFGKEEQQQLEFAARKLRLSVELAMTERDDFWDREENRVDRIRPLVAASLGPAGDNITLWSGATDPDTANHSLPDATILDYYSRKISALSLAGPDLFALESLPSSREACLALDALAETAPDAPTWVTFICLDETSTSGGDSIGDAVSQVVAHSSRRGINLVACGVNCTSMNHLEALLQSARTSLPAKSGTSLICYPNSGELWDAREGARCWHGDDDVHLDGSHALDMKNWGATVIGGCCRVTHEQIAAFRAALLVK